jgi:3,4-dihydroxy 2-butanone 4-phosphate synthase/GTP cyclohydrolase II
MNSALELIEDIRQGKMVILVDDEDRENEGDIVLAADFISPEKINFMIQKARGLVCLALTSEQVDRLGLPMMVNDDSNRSPNKTAFTVSIEAAHGVSTGISAQDRAHTIRVASNPKSTAADVIAPGHIFPIRAQAGGVLKRAGHTEGSVDLARLAGLTPAAVICEVINDDGSMARVPHLKEFAREYGLKIGSIVDLIEYRLQNETLVREVARRDIRVGEMTLQARVFKSDVDGSEHLALVKGVIRPDRETLVRVHTENVLADVFAFDEPANAPGFRRALKLIEQAESGVFLHLRPPQRVMHIAPLLERATRPDELDYGVGAQILKSIGVGQLALLTNHPSHRPGLKAFGLEITENRSF